MSPLSFEWQWNADHYIFLGLLYLALTIIGGGLIFAFLKSWFELSSGKDEHPPKLAERSKYSSY